MHKLKDEDVKEIINEALKREKRAAHALGIVSVEVSEGVDADGDEILIVEVVFDGKEKINPANIYGVVREVRSKLFEKGELAFPLFSFVSNADPGFRKRETARSA